MRDTQVTYRFGEWLVEPYLNRLSKEGKERQIEPRTMDVLGCLLARAGQVVTTDELLDEVWAGRHAEPVMVAKRINQIRRALGDDARDPEYIATILKRGYRTIAPVDPVHHTGETTSTDFLAELEAQTPPFPAYDGNGRYVFVCYAHTDRAAIYPELLQLRDAGINVWYDEGITPGSEWSEELASAIIGCTWFRYYVSPASVASDHCRAEAQFAVRHSKALLAVHLEQTVLPDGLDLFVSAKQALHKYEISHDVYQRKLLTA
ncbi:MAG: TIR domain-containing protein, partial [Gammaproteobacteria bacterium]